MIVHQIVPQIMLWSLDEFILQLLCYEPRGAGWTSNQIFKNGGAWKDLKF